MVDKTRGTMPTGQQSRGTPQAEMPNRKSVSRRNSIGSKGDGTDGQRPVVPDPDRDTFTGWGELGERGSRKDKGSPGGVPDPKVVNAYPADAGTSSRSASSQSAERIYPVDPGKQKLGSTGGVVGSEQRQTPRGGSD